LFPFQCFLLTCHFLDLQAQGGCLKW
jgi:hypothetical protein